MLGASGKEIGRRGLRDCANSAYNGRHPWIVFVAKLGSIDIVTAEERFIFGFHYDSMR